MSSKEFFYWEGHREGQMVRQQMGSPDGIDYWEMVFEKVVFHHILVLEMAFKKDLDDSVILNCMFY